MSNEAAGTGNGRWSRPKARRSRPRSACGSIRVRAETGRSRRRKAAAAAAPGWALSSPKRLLDILLAALGLAIAAPLLLLAGWGIWLLMRRPVFFCQQRLGLDGKPFIVYKLRTMEDSRIPGDAIGTNRLTPLGRFLRRWSLDELPQLWNVLRGEMSLAGPRPLPLDYAGRYNAKQRRRHDVRPGVTGWAQVRGRNELSWERRFELDLWYVDNASPWLDLEILARSVGVVLSGAGVQPRQAVLMPEFLGEGHADRHDAA